ncbi:NAD(P)-binding protein [Daldinia grandis]|nr:NAD(P)-binding protein [Daldinia grandis]
MPSVTFTPDQDIPDLGGQVIIVTGGNSGLGLETVRQLAKHNPARICLAARSQEKAETALKQLRESNPQISPISFLKLDLSSFASIKDAAKTFLSSESRLDILVNNAGIMMTPEGLTTDGYEIQFGTNVMGPALFTQLLLPILRETSKINPQTRVVNLSSGTERLAPKDAYPFNELKTTMSHRHTAMRYSLSKLADIHYTSALAERFTDVKCICVHPGAVATNLHANTTGVFLRPFLYAAALFTTSVEQGALSQIWAAVSPEAKSGEFYSPVGVPGKGSKASRNRELQENLWQWIQGELKDQLQA